jgi:hypothetical protein
VAASPYRNALPSPAAGRTRVRYYPCVGLWPLAIALVIGVPIALWARRDAHVPSTVSCSTVSAPGNDRFCFAHDGRSLEPNQQVSCRSTPAALEAYMETSNPFMRPIVAATEVDMPNVPDLRTMGGECTDPLASTRPKEARPFAPLPPTPVTDPSEGISPDAARLLVSRCALQPETSGPQRTVTISVLQRDYSRGALVLAGLVALALASMLRRRATIDVDRSSKLIRVVERGFFRVKRRLSWAVGALETAVVATGPCGMLNGKRVELVSRGGERLPLIVPFVLMTSRVHARTARRLAELIAQLKPDAPPEAVPVPPWRGRALIALTAALACLAIAGTLRWRSRAHVRQSTDTSAQLARVGTTRDGSTIVVASLGGSRIAIVADEDARSIRAFAAPAVGDMPADAATDVFEVALSSKPGAMVVDPRGRLFVAMPQESSVAVFETSPQGPPSLHELHETDRISTAAEPVALSLTPDDTTLVVVSYFGHSLETFALTTLSRGLEVDLPRSPRAMTLSADGRRAFVAHDTGSRISVVDLGTGASWGQPLDTSAPSLAFDPSGPGQFGNAGAKASPTLQARVTRIGSVVYAPGVVVSTGDPFARPVHQYYGGGQRLVNGFDLAAFDFGGPGTPSGAAPRPWRARNRIYGRPGGNVIISGTPVSRGKPSAGATPLSCLLPRAVVADEAHQWLYVACAGPGRVFKVDVSERGRCFDEGAWGAAYDVGDGPTGMAIDADDHALLVWSQFDETMTALPLDPGMDTGRAFVKAWGPLERESAPEWIHAARSVPRDARQTLIARGRSLFYQTDNSRIANVMGSTGGGAACASCHIDGRDDGLTWQTPQGPRQTVMLAGRVAGTAPYGWAGDEPTLQAHLEETFRRLAGTGLAPDEIEALVAYIESLEPPRFTVHDRDRVARGRAIFDSEAAGCSGCHSTAEGNFTDYLRHDVRSRVPVDSTGMFDTPSLLFVGGTAPYFHDGRYATLAELLAKSDGAMGHTKQLDADQRRDLVAFLESIGGNAPSSHANPKEALAW